MMVFNGIPWHVVRVRANSPALIDRQGRKALATTDPRTRTVSVSEDVDGAKLAHVLAHEATHACMVSYGMLDDVRAFSRDRIRAEEWACNLMADHAAEVLAAVRANLK